MARHEVQDEFNVKLLGHPDQESFVHQIRERFPDENIRLLFVEKDKMKVEILVDMPLQFRINIFSVLQRYVNEVMSN